MKTKRHLPKALFITNNCFSKNTSNGRTLEEIFSFFPKVLLAQFYVNGGDPDFEFCSNFFRISDKDALKNIYKKSGGKLIERKETVITKIGNDRAYRRNAFTLTLRNVIWNLNVWKKTGFNEWVDEFNPQIVITMVGDSSFIFKIATSIAKQKNIPLIVLNTEAYFFKDYNYFKDSPIYASSIYSIFHKLYKKSYVKLMQHASYVFYSCQKLADDYNKVFSVPNKVVYTPSSISIAPYRVSHDEKKDIRISYIGNLGLERHKSLIEIGKVLFSYNPQIKLSVFGDCTAEAKEELIASKGVDYHGKIPYSQVVNEIEHSDILIHVESFDSFYVEDIKYGFTTKIADSLQSGRCFFVYAPHELACSSYISAFNPECVASSLYELKTRLIQLIENPILRHECAKRGKNIALNNHESKINEKIIKQIIQSIIDIQ